MTPERFQQALSAWREALGPAHVLTADAELAPYRANVSGIERRLPAVLRPGCVGEVQAAVRIAGRFGCPLHPVSTGRNWGLGSRLPPRDGTAVVDLGRMNRIREVNAEFAYAVIEPGVTQRALHEHIVRHRLPLVLNVTGSGGDTSLIGNALERGVGYFASRATEICDLEVVLGSGQIIRTGFGHYAGSRNASLYGYGPGPSLDGLFAQSNLGIVTRATMHLMPAPPFRAALVARIAEETDLARFIDLLGDLRRRDILRTVVHVGNHHRTEIAMGPIVRSYLLRQGVSARDVEERTRAFLRREGFGVWSAVCGLMGTRSHVQAVRREMQRTLRGVARTLYMTDGKLRVLRALADVMAFLPAVARKRSLLPAVTEYHRLACGVPTNETLKSVYWSVGEPAPEGDSDPDQHPRCGLLYALPMVPLSGACAREVADLTVSVFGRHGFDAYITFNLLDVRIMEGVINLAFDRTQPDRVRAAHAAVDELLDALAGRGWYPYRLGIQSMERFVSAEDPFWRTVRDIKRVLDPHGIIAPGRYNLD